MVRVSIDNRISEYTVDPSKSLKEILSEICLHLPPNRVVTEVSVDGRMVPRLEEQAKFDRFPENIKELQIRTSDKEVWKANGLELAQSTVERVQRSLIRVAEMFRESNGAAANHLFARCVDSLEKFIESLTITRHALKLDFDRLFIDGMSFSRIEYEFSDIFKSILSHQQNQDHESIADKIEFELLPNLYVWSRAIKQIRLSHCSNA